MKRDYIPGLGDCIDMAVIGASWEKERARELRGMILCIREGHYLTLLVGTDTFTTSYVAALTDKGVRKCPYATAVRLTLADFREA